MWEEKRLRRDRSLATTLRARMRAEKRNSLGQRHVRPDGERLVLLEGADIK